MIHYLLAQASEATGTPAASPTPATTAPVQAAETPLFVIPTFDHISSFFTTLLISLGVGLVVYFLVFYVLRLIFRRRDQQVGLLALNVLQLPVLAIVLFTGLKIAFENLKAGQISVWLANLFNALLVVAIAYGISQLFTQVIVYYLKIYAEQSEAMWDDVLIPILENTVPVVIYVIAGFLFLQDLGFNLSGLFVAFGGITFVLGFALQSILFNFFSGLVLLIDSPFQFGDVISLPDGSLAVIKSIGLRVTKLFLIDSNCELFIPNGMFQMQKIVNLTRPAPNYYYSINFPLRADADASKAMKIIREVIVGHPDTLGELDEKIALLEHYYESQDDDTEYSQRRQAKKELAKARLINERDVNNFILRIREYLGDLQAKIQDLEKGGLEGEEIRRIQGKFLEIVKLIGLELIKDRQGNKRLVTLEEAPKQDGTLIGAVRAWYKSWAADPDLTEEDPEVLAQEWERKIQLLKMRMNKLFQKISQPSIDETRLDDYVSILSQWLNDSFKNTDTLWVVPKIWTQTVEAMGMVAMIDYVAKFYVDNIKLEQCQRGNRIKSEVQGELIRQLRKIYIYR